jgi:peptide/nickel transport system permease protein
MNQYWNKIWSQFQKRRLGVLGLYIVALFCLIGVYAPFLASSKPLFVVYDGESYFPLFRYLFYREFFTKRLDIFFNIMMFTLPLSLIALKCLKAKQRLIAVITIILIQFVAFAFLAVRTPQDPAADPLLNQERHLALQNLRKKGLHQDWDFELRYMTPYAKLNMLLRYQQRKAQNQSLQYYSTVYGGPLPTLWNENERHEAQEVAQLKEVIQRNQTAGTENSAEARSAQSELAFLHEKQQWLEEEGKKLRFMIMPLLSHFHWEDDAGGEQKLNQYLHWWQLTRINHKDLLAALIFGVRISLVVGITAVGLAMLIGIPVGALAGFYGGRMDIVVSRLLEIWEAMPTFFMLLMVVAILQSKSIFIVICVIGIFGWTTFSRYIRGEFFKQRGLPYVEACRAQGFQNGYVMFKHILPNAIPPVLTLLPFAIMGAITSEAGLSFLGLGEEGSCSWGVLMDEGRTAFPQESYLLWPPAIALTLLLIAIAIVGDSLRDALDPKTYL